MSLMGKVDEPSTSRSMLHLAQRGDDDAWQQIAQIYGPIVYAWARRCGCQPADSADVMQETFAAVAKALSTFDHTREGATFRGWLWTIARNKVRDLARKKDELAAGGTDAQIKMQQVVDPARTLAEQEEPPSELEADSQSVRSRMLELIRSSIDPRSWTMFWETAVVGRDPQEVADDMGVSRWAVYKARARVLHRLQRDLDGME